MSLTATISRARLVAVLTVDSTEQAVLASQALHDGGITAIELTLRTPVAIDAIRAVRSRVPELFVGAGTVLSTAQVDQVQDAGAHFAVAPGLDPAIVEAAAAAGLPFAPGVATPSELGQALALGCKLLKLFPAGHLGGLPYIETIAAPFAHLAPRFIPLGGVTLANTTDYLRSPLIAAVGGSFLAPPHLIQSGSWSTITRKATQTLQACP
jgi:2-dehydro-3-deoxyphosphogluconate aldolase / (4S)-4-hydroxy-2-oxoglutarate aldolase